MLFCRPLDPKYDSSVIHIFQQESCCWCTFDYKKVNQLDKMFCSMSKLKTVEWINPFYVRFKFPLYNISLSEQSLPLKVISSFSHYSLSLLSIFSPPLEKQRLYIQLADSTLQKQFVCLLTSVELLKSFCLYQSWLDTELPELWLHLHHEWIIMVQMDYH